MKVASSKVPARVVYMKKGLRKKKNMKQKMLENGCKSIASPQNKINKKNKSVTLKKNFKKKTRPTEATKSYKNNESGGIKTTEEGTQSLSKITENTSHEEVVKFKRLVKDIAPHTNGIQNLEAKDIAPHTNGIQNLEAKVNNNELIKKRKQFSDVPVKLLPKRKKTNKKIISTAADTKADKQEEMSVSFSDEYRGEEIQTLSGEEIGAVDTKDSREEGQKALLHIINPYSEEEFMRNYWEKKPLLIKRNDAHYYKSLFTTFIFDKILHQNMVLYTKNLDITSYSNGKRETHNPIGQALAPVVWDYYNNGCSIRMLNPQTFHRPVWKLLATLQEHFMSFCGANVYLTPPNTQGFAPHWDDIEAFILQLEGKKQWKVYSPRSENEELPVNSSDNLSQDEIGKPILDIVLNAGDLLYFPRGYIHQGCAVDNTHSLHITISTYQKNTWGHLLETLLPQALNTAMSEDIEFRRGLPCDYLDYMGIVNMDKDSPSRKAFIQKLGELVGRLMNFAPVDAAVDQRGASLMHDSLPPFLKKKDRICSAYGGGERWCEKKMKVINSVELKPDTPIRLLRRNCLRVVPEEECVKVYHCLENTREYHQEEPQYIELIPENAPAVEALIHAYPEYLTIESLPLSDEIAKMAVASGLWERGLVVTARPLNSQLDN
ncbi:hypothetical protein OTU49_014781 [Cherax quadricarinatus]|uniref:Bifunctional lysine-specific demethylase and histidyl-hydroxylase n=1 Tax=Cherax quadricarinatus TaxID=27406 RepID=A0AAW0YJH0_CHEQU